jgi:hypothetical protein
VHQTDVLQADQVHPVQHIGNPQVFIKVEDFLAGLLAVVKAFILKDSFALGSGQLLSERNAATERKTGPQEHN